MPSDLHKLVLRLEIDPSTAPGDPSRLIPVFQAWLQKGALRGLWIDAADYSHVPLGPAAVLVGHEANLAFERGAEGPFLSFQGKTPQAGGAGDVFLRLLGAAVQAAGLLEAEAGFKPRLRFLPRLQAIFNDRLQAGEAAGPEFKAALAQAWAALGLSGPDLDRESGGRWRLRGGWTGGLGELASKLK